MSNPVYISDTVFHKKEAEEVGFRRQRQFPKGDWKTCEGTHEGIVSKALFGWVNSDSFRMRIKKDGKGSGKVPQEYDSVRYCEGEKRKR